MKHETRKPGTRKGFAALVALVLILCVTIGGTIAWITAQTPAVTNRFEPASVSTTIEETRDGIVKKDVFVKNTSDIPAYIRAAIVVNWVDKDGNVYASVPDGVTYTMTTTVGQSDSKWAKQGDYYYYTEPVAANGQTGYLITSCTPDADAAAKGYYLQVTILAEAIQAQGGAVQNAWPGAPITNS